MKPSALLIASLFLNVCRAADPVVRPTYALDDIERSRVGNLSYQCRLLRAPDGGLIGVSLRLSNMSEKTPLRVGVPAARPPLYVCLSASKDEELTLTLRRISERSRANIIDKHAVLTLAPNGVEDYFVAARDVLPDNFQVGDRKSVMLEVITLDVPDDGESMSGESSGRRKILIDRPSRTPVCFTVENVKLTDDALKVDAQVAYREALKNSK